jgi:hypothetical protein
MSLNNFCFDGSTSKALQLFMFSFHLAAIILALRPLPLPFFVLHFLWLAHCSLKYQVLDIILPIRPSNCSPAFRLTPDMAELYRFLTKQMNNTAFHARNIWQSAKCASFKVGKPLPKRLFIICFPSEIFLPLVGMT